MRYYMLNKPKGYITATEDKHFPTVMELFTENERKALHPVGRLDIDTEGLLIITDDGELTFRLTRPEFAFKKQYYFMAFGELTEEKAKTVQSSGALYGNGAPRKPAIIESIEHHTVSACSEFIPAEKFEHCMKNPNGVVSTGMITVTEGKRHEVKLILKSLGCSIFYLKRISMGEIKLDDTLKAGEYRPLNEKELALVSEYRKIWIDL